jgi:hypothetical protein
MTLSHFLDVRAFNGPLQTDVPHTLTVSNIYTQLTRYLGYKLASLTRIYFVFQNINERDMPRHLAAIRINCFSNRNILSRAAILMYVYCTNKGTSYLV